MRKQVFFAVILVIILASFVYAAIPRTEPSLSQAEKDIILTKMKFSDKVSDEVISQLENKDKIRVIVSLDDSNLARLKKLEKIRPKIKENQNKVLKNIPGLKIIYQYNNINSLAVEIDAKKLEQLESLGVVKKISDDKPMYLSLDESVPQIQGGILAGQLDEDGNDCTITLKQCLTGAEQTVCIVDTGVDYTHPAIGGASCNPYRDWGPEPYTEQVPYGQTKIYPITKTGYTSIAVHFQYIQLVRGGYERIEILDGSDNLLQTIKSNLPLGDNPPWCDASSYFISNFWSISVPGDTIKIKFISTLLAAGGCGEYSIDKVANGIDWTNCGDFAGGFDFVEGHDDPMDDHGHGTHVAGIITSNDATYKGVAPNAKIVAVKVFDASGQPPQAFDTDVAFGIDYCIDMKEVYGIDIISLSLGDGLEHTSNCDLTTDSALEVNAAVTARMFVSVASGNQEFTNGINSPACASGATSVGAVDKSDVLYANTNRGSLLDLLAPGVDIKSTVLNFLFDFKSGTSMAAPHVAGLAALMLEANPYLKPSQIEYIMKTTGVTIDGYPYPRIDALAAVNAAKSFISITVSGYPINFGNLNPGTSDNLASGTYSVTIDSSTNVNVDLYEKGTDFSVGGNSFAVSNLKWYNSNNLGSAFTMGNEFIKDHDVISNIAKDTVVPMYYWLSIPAGQPAGENYQSQITIKAVKTGTSP